MYVEELIGPETVNTMPLETIEAFQDHGEVRGDTVLEGVDEAQELLERARARRASTTTTSSTRSRQRACRSSATRSTRSSRASARSAAPWRPRDEPRSSSASGRAIRRLDRRGRGAAGSAGSTSRGGMREDVDLLLQFADSVVDRDRRRRPARHGRLVARARGDQADVPAGDVPRPRHDASAGDPRRSRRRSTSARTLFISASKSGSTLETRSHTDYFWERAGATASSSPRSPIPARELEELARERELRARSSRASRRSAAATPRCRRSGWCPRR